MEILCFYFYGDIDVAVNYDLIELDVLSSRRNAIFCKITRFKQAKAMDYVEAFFEKLKERDDTGRIS